VRVIFDSYAQTVMHLVRLMQGLIKEMEERIEHQVNVPPRQKCFNHSFGPDKDVCYIFFDKPP